MIRKLWVFALLGMSLALAGGLAAWEWVEWGTLSRETEENRVIDMARSILASMRSEAAPEIQIRGALREFSNQVNDLTPTILADGPSKLPQWTGEVKGLHRSILFPWLPKHDLVVSGFARKGQGNPATGTWCTEGCFGFSGEKAQRLITHISQPKSERESARHDVCEDLRETLHFPVEAGQDRDLFSLLQEFSTPAGLKGLFLDRLENMAIGALVDMEKLDDRLGMRMIAARNPAGAGLAGFFPRDGSKPLLSPTFSDNPQLAAWVGNRISSEGKLRPIEVYGEWLVFSGSVNFNPLWEAVLVMPRPSRPSIPHSGALGLILVLPVFIIVITMKKNDSSEQGKSWYPSVGLTLLATCLSLVLLSVGGIRALIRRTALEFGERLRDQASQELHSDLESLDRRNLILQADFVEEARRLSGRPGLVKRLMESASPRETTLLLKCLARSGRTSIKFCQRSVFQNILWVGPEGHQGGWAYQGSREGVKSLLTLFGPFCIDILTYFYPGSAVSSPHAGGRKSIKQELTEDTVKEVLKNLLGPDILLSCFNSPTSLLKVENNQLRVSMFTIPVPEEPGGYPRHLMLWIWADWIEKEFLLWCIEHEWKSTQFGSGSSWEARPSEFTGGWRLPHQPKAFALGIMGEYWSFLRVPEKLPLFKPLEQLIDQVKTSGEPFRGRALNAPGKPLIEAAPGRFGSKVVFGAIRTTDDLESLGNQVFWAGTLFSLLVLAGAVFLARRGRDQVLVPLTTLSEGMQEMGRGNFAARLALDRNDEFGTLATSFNTLARALEEGNLLRSYVSGSVRRVVGDGEALETARKGALRDVSVLFSSIEGLDDSGPLEDPGILMTRLGNHLAAFNSAIGRFGGEIDKVIGDKIMVIFDHERLGGTHQAALKALSVVRAVKEALRDAKVHVVMGINSGPVIAGILGAAQVRLDYTVIGDTVNLASRLATLAHTVSGTQVVLSGATLANLEGKVKVEKLPFKKVKGKTQEVEAYLLLE